MTSLEFKYSRAALFLIAAGVPVAFVAVAVLGYTSYSLLRIPDLSVTVRAASIIVGGLAVLFAVALARALMTWRSFVSTYVLDDIGVHVGGGPSGRVLTWSKLQSVRYSILGQQIVLRFSDYPHAVVLNNVTMDLEKRLITSAQQLIEVRSSRSIRRTLL